MLYLALGGDGIIYNLCDCGDFEAADESARDLGIDVVWIWDADAAREVASLINYHLKTYPQTTGDLNGT